MDQSQATNMLAALAQETRLAAFRLLVAADPGGLPAGAIAQRLGILQNTMSGHLGALADAGLIAGHRAGRAVRYQIEADAVRALFAFLAEDCCAGRPELCGLVRQRDQLPFGKAWAAGRVFNVLFLCTANSARSILAEAIVNHDHASRFRAYSAGSDPSGEVAPESVVLIERLGYPTTGLRSKSWSEFSRLGAPKMDFVFTLCDAAAEETCPVWPGAPMSAHWGIPDPKSIPGGAAQRNIAFAQSFRMLERRIGVFANLPFAELERIALKKRLDEIGADQADRI